jgi:hypothetical protein
VPVFFIYYLFPDVVQFAFFFFFCASLEKEGRE